MILKRPLQPIHLLVLTDYLLTLSSLTELFHSAYILLVCIFTSILLISTCTVDEAFVWLDYQTISETLVWTDGCLVGMAFSVHMRVLGRVQLIILCSGSVS